jgi:serine/threonine protein kinase
MMVMLCKHADEIELATIMRALLGALAFIHTLDVIHRDVKVLWLLLLLSMMSMSICVMSSVARQADNLLINEHGQPKLADFGVSGMLTCRARARMCVLIDSDEMYVHHVARAGQQQSPLTSMVGTPAFIAPEVRDVTCV